MNKLQIISSIPKGIPLALQIDKLDYCNHSYMCISTEGSSSYSVPNNLEHLVLDLISGIYAASPYLYDNDYKYNCYLSIKHEYVQPGASGNREGWHIDGFKSDQLNFIWFNSIPTQVCLGNFIITNDHDISLEEMEKQALLKDKSITKLDINKLYELNQQCVHCVTPNDSSEAILRTFIKLTFSKEIFNLYGNAWNYKLPHIKPNKFRKDIRNHGRTA